MADLLIHSMAEFSDLILDALRVADARDVVEIGAEYGGMTSLLADHLAGVGGRLTSIDPAPKPDFLRWVGTRPEVAHRAEPSLTALPSVAAADAWLIDGDHNWYTVYNELHAIGDACGRDGKPLLAFLHDVAWPCARRDRYYAPDAIPSEFRHPHSFDAGALPGAPGLVAGRGFRGMGQFAWACHEGGARNGVLTAIEDFAEERRTAGRPLAFCEVPAVFGLGILFDLDAPWGEAMAELVVPFHDNKLLATLERNRLANYLQVIDWQDRAAA